MQDKRIFSILTFYRFLVLPLIGVSHFDIPMTNVILHSTHDISGNTSVNRNRHIQDTTWNMTLTWHFMCILGVSLIRVSHFDIPMTNVILHSTHDISGNTSVNRNRHIQDTTWNIRPKPHFMCIFWCFAHLFFAFWHSHDQCHTKFDTWHIRQHFC